MKKFILTIGVFIAAIYIASAQYIPTTQFGIKAGANLTNLSKTGTFNSGNELGYQVGFYSRFGDFGFVFQPEVYITSKNLSLSEKGVASEIQFTSVDIPLLVGAKIGEYSFGARFYTGPVVSFNTTQKQVFSKVAANLSQINYKDLNYGWQLGAGLDFNDASVDIRYEAGLNKQTYSPGTNTTKVNLVSVSLAYRIF